MKFGVDYTKTEKTTFIGRPESLRRRWTVGFRALDADESCLTDNEMKSIEWIRKIVPLGSLILSLLITGIVIFGLL